MERDVIEIVGIDSLVSQDHLLRKIDQAVDFKCLYEMVGPLYCEDNGRPSIDPRSAVQDGADLASVRAAAPAAEGGGGLPQQCVSLVSGA